MKTTLSFITIFFLAPLAVLGQKKIPKDILSTSSSLTITSSKEKYDQTLQKSLQKFKDLGIKINYSVHIDENPTLRMESAQKIKNELSSQSSKYIYNIQENIANLSYNYLLIIMDANNFDTPKTKIHYLVKARTLDELLEKYVKDLRKL